MENMEYNRLIYEKRLNELANIWNVMELTHYKYCRKYLLEYLLENNIHTTIMDNYAIKDKLWINLYIKYGITKPLVNAPLNILLEKENNKYILETLLDEMSYAEAIALYCNIKYTWVWLYRKKETEIINIYEKNNIVIPRTFIQIPEIADKKTNSRDRIDKILQDFMKVYHDIDNDTMKTYLEEIKRSFKVDFHRTHLDILKLISYKEGNPDFKLVLDDMKIFEGQYSPSDDIISIDKHIHGLFTHELSHFLFDQYEELDNEELYKEYCQIRKKIMKKSCINKIIEYLKEFHNRYDYMEDIFKELYFKNVEKQYGNVNNYYLRIYNEIMTLIPEKMILDNDTTIIYIDYGRVGDSIKELVSSECNDFVKVGVSNYYREELSLENLLDSLLLGRINEGEYEIDCYSGHSRKYFKNEKNSSIDECLANYDEIKKSTKADLLIDKLVELVGPDLVELLEKYLKRQRGSKKKILKYNKR